MDYVLAAVLCLCIVTNTVHCQMNGTWTPQSYIQINSSGVECPPWFFYNTTSSQCECYRSPDTDDIVKCTKHGALLKLGYCMTHEEGKGFFLGLCNYFKLSRYRNLSSEGNYIVLPSNTSELNDFMCGPLDRKGVLCSECRDGYGPSVTSIGHTCSNCTEAWYRVPLYLFLEFVPITVFYFIVLFFRINVTSAPMIAFIFYCQIGVSTFLVMSNRYLFDTTLTYRFLNILITFYGVWNLDFFRYIIPPFCVSPYLKPIHITFLYYISAVYPLCLIALSWMFIELYSRDCKAIVWVWRKLNKYVLKMSVKWDAKNTMIDVFATFFLLSYAKLVFTCFRTVSFRITINANNFSTHNTLHVKSDPSLGYFSGEHLPFAITSCVIFVVAILPLPILLALYPVGAFRSLLFKCRIGTRPMAALNIFVEKFYSCYRDGLDGGRDMRSFVSMHFLLRVLGNYLSVDEILVNLSFTVIILLYIVSTLLIAIIRPYKRTYMNVLDTLIFANLAILSLVIDKHNELGHSDSSFSSTFYELSGSLLSTIPLIGLSGVVVYRILKKILDRMPCCQQFLKRKQKINQDVEASTHVALGDDAEDPELPDRLLRPQLYALELSQEGSIEQTQLNQHAANDYGSIE